MRRLNGQAMIAEHADRHPETVVGCRACALRSAAKADPAILDFLTEQGIDATLRAYEAEVKPHRIIESFLDDTTQLVRCACGIETTFARDRYLTGGIKPAHALAEFVCSGQIITFKNALLREV